MKLQDYINPDKLAQAIADGFINVRKHPTLPLSVLNYGPAAQFDQHWPHEVCACRGLIVDGEDNIVSRPMYKFFNLDQPSTIITGATRRGVVHLVEEDVMVDEGYLLEEVRRGGYPLTITRKMDGMMGVLWNYDNQWGISTRGSFESEGAAFATQRWQKFVKAGVVEFIPKGWTLIFEIIAKHLRIVVPYEWEGLCLLTAVNNVTGEEMPYEELHDLWLKLNPQLPDKLWCQMVGRFDINIAEAQADPAMDAEGYVISVNRRGLPPVKAKVKLAEYKRLHRILTGITPQMIWTELASPMDPWLMTESKYNRKTGETTHTMNVPKDFADWVKQWQRGLTKAFHTKLLLALEASTLLKRNPAVFKHDAERRGWLATQGFERDIVSAALLLFNEREAEAYENLWKLVRPFGRDDKFYIEGKGE